ncbi:MAG: thiosulfate oxidation carrier protein SoxY [Gammaproteobacteria bacterium]|nr:thiosulfate oxidation carrier protein SoxY [Gammaproteobacteria bacterium]
MQRRSLVKILLATPFVSSLFKSAAVFANWNIEAFTKTSEKEALESFFPDREILESDAISIDVHDLIENGAVVPVKIKTELNAVSGISLLVERNPNPLIAHFDLSPECRPFVATRIKIGVPSDIIAVVESEGKLYSRRKFVEVVEGGCG